MNKIKVGIIGATGMVGQRLITLLGNHPWFDLVFLSASSKSAGRRYGDAVADRWKLDLSIPQSVKKMKVSDISEIGNSGIKLVFCALNLEKDAVLELENSLAGRGLAVVSNNSANRNVGDVPMLIPEINRDHLELIGIQKKRRGNKGFIVVKPNCSIQSYLPVIYAIRDFGPETVSVTTLQAVSGSGKTLSMWPEMSDNVIPFIPGEEEKTEMEPLKILGELAGGQLKNADKPVISATCIRVPVSDGHEASVGVKFKISPRIDQIKDAIARLNVKSRELGLPSSPPEFIRFFEDPDRPQTKLDRDAGNGMTVSCGRFREDKIFDWKFVGLSHNTIRGAAGGSVLTAELLVKDGYL